MNEPLHLVFNSTVTTNITPIVITEIIDLRIVFWVSLFIFTIEIILYLTKKYEYQPINIMLTWVVAYLLLITTYGADSWVYKGFYPFFIAIITIKTLPFLIKQATLKLENKRKNG